VEAEGTLPALEDRIDECGKWAALREDDEPTKEQQKDHDREQPPFLLLSQKLEVLGDDPQLFHGVASIDSGFA